MTENILEMRSITKEFPGVKALQDVTLEVRRGEIHAICGENGAGKSTLMKVVMGIERADAGEVLVAGSPLRPGDPAAATRAGIGMVHQHLSLVGRLTVWQNVTLGEGGALDREATVRRVEEIAERYGLEVDPHARVEDLTPGQRQRVEIVKCLRADPKVIILDEPTSVLTQAESDRLFEVLRRLVDDHGHGVVLISHRLEEIMSATDRVVVLRSGRAVAARPTAGCDAQTLASLMLGRELKTVADEAAVGLEPAALSDGGSTSPAGAALVLHEVRVEGDGGKPRLDDLSLEVAAGEIVGVAGVEGNGQTVLVDLLSGLERASAGAITVTGAKPGDLSSIAVIPPDRHESGCVLEMSIAENLVMGRLDPVTRRGLLDRRAIERTARALVEEFDIAVHDLHAPMWTLSGGNQQKVVVARELSKQPRVIVAAQPTRGLDVGAMEYLWGRLRGAARDGAAVLLVSTELDEVLALSHRVLVMFRGRIIGEMPRQEVDLDRLGLLMGGTAA